MRTQPFRAICVLVTLLIVGGVVAPLLRESGAQSSTPIAADTLPASTDAVIDFPRGIEVTGTLDLSYLEPHESGAIELRYRIGRDETIHLVTASSGERAAGETSRVDVMIDLQSSFIPSGVDLRLFWRVPLLNGGYAESEEKTVLWFDNRWAWETIASTQVTLRYFDLDAAFAASILDSAQTTVSDLERRFSLDRGAPISVWIYPSADAFRGAQQPNSREAVAGASYPGFLLITAIIPEGDLREIGRVIPHEVSHQVLYQATENPFTLPPLWFDEGIATHYQVGGTDGFLEMVIHAREQCELFNAGSLDTSFPYSSRQATLAYATSWTIIAYIREVHGDEGIGAMIREFATGVPYPVAIERAIGLSEDELNREWHRWISSQTPAGAVECVA